MFQLNQHPNKGGSQSKKDQQGRKPKSAGATLRRYNQQQLEQVRY
jgi:hypothetical protein